jgi:two-component system sensor histidine kinase EvgS
MVTPEGQADGFSVELLRAALKAVGREATFKTGVWSEIKADLAEGRLEVLPLVGRTPEREATYDFTFPYLTMHGTIVVRDTNADIQGPADLRGKQVAVLGGDNAEEYLHRADLGAAIVPLPSFETALRGLSSGKYDAVVIQKLLAFQLMRQAGITNLRVVSPPLKEFTQNFCFAVRNGNGALLAQLNEGLAIAMADGTSRRLHAKWFSALEAMGLSKSRIVVGGDDDYPPSEFLDENG